MLFLMLVKFHCIPDGVEVDSHKGTLGLIMRDSSEGMVTH